MSAYIEAEWDIWIKDLRETIGKFNTRTFPIPRVGEWVNIIKDKKEFYGQVEKIEYFMDSDEREKIIYVVLEGRTRRTP